MADPKEDKKGDEPSSRFDDVNTLGETAKERQAAFRGEAPGGKLGQLSEGVRNWRWMPEVRYGPDDRQKYLQDVARRAFEYQNPEQGPMTAYQAARGDKYQPSVEAGRAHKIAGFDVDLADQEGKIESGRISPTGSTFGSGRLAEQGRLYRGEEPYMPAYPEGPQTIGEMDPGSIHRIMQQVDAAAKRSGMTVDEYLEAIKAPSERFKE